MAWARLCRSLGLGFAVAALSLGCSLAPGTTAPGTTAPGTTAPGTSAVPGPRVLAEFTIQPLGVKAPTDADAAAIRDIFMRRLEATGLVGPTVTVRGATILVDLPGVSDAGAIEHLLGSTGRLDFVLLPPARYGTNALNPEGPTGVVVGQPLPSSEAILLSNDEIATVSQAVDQSGNRAVTFSLKPAGAKLLLDWSTNNVGTYVAIVLDGLVLSAPAIREPTPSGNVMISGRFTAQDASELETILRFGPLPFPVTETGRTVVNP